MSVLLTTLGIVLFVVGVLLSVALHELGHMLPAKAFGMKVTQFFVGFGRTLWSTKRGETEYGIKAIPAGGYVKIVGMTHLEDLPEEDDARAFWRYPAWKRITVMSAGSITHFLLAIVVLYFAAVSVGLPFSRAVIGQIQSCVASQPNKDDPIPECRPSDPRSPAAEAGLRPDDRIVAVDGVEVESFEEAIKQIRQRPDKNVPLRIVRDGHTRTVTVHIEPVRRTAIGNEKPDPKTGLATVGAIGASFAPVEHFGAASGVGATFRFTGQMFSNVFTAIGDFPQKVPKLVDALTGKPRDPNSPVSVVGASRVGGQAVEAGSWLVFLMVLASLNVFIGVFNLFPLLPLDGGHVAILLFERARSGIARMLGRADPGRVDMNKLVPVTLLVIVLFGGVSLLAILADVVNPIQNPFR